MSKEFRNRSRKKLERLNNEITLKGTQALPLLERLNLGVTARDVLVTGNFTYITRLIWHLDWASAKITMTMFADITALPIGVQVELNKVPILPTPIQANHDFAETAYDTRIDSDTAAAPSHHLTSRLSFFKFMPIGIRMDNNSRLIFKIQDNLSALSFVATVQGWRGGA